MNQDEIVAKYGPIVLDKNGNPSFQREKDFMVVVNVEVFNMPWDVSASSKYPNHIYMNKDMVPHFAAAMQNIKSRCRTSELKTFDGCFNPRKQRGSNDMWSAHSWGMAIDLNAAENQIGTPGKLSQGFVKCWTDAGFYWGGNFFRKDPMHFSLFPF